MDYMESAQAALTEGDYQTAALHLIALYQESGCQSEYLNIIHQIFVEPNQEALDAAFEENLAFLSEEYPQYPLPKQKYLKYSALPIDEDATFLFSVEDQTFLPGPFTETQRFYLWLLSGETPPAAPALEEQLSLESHFYSQLGDALFQSVNSLLEKEGQPASSLLGQIETYRQLKPFEDFHLYLLAKYYLRKGELQTALEYAKKALRYNFKNVKKMLLLADIYHQMGNLVEEGRIFGFINMVYQEAPINYDYMRAKFLDCVMRAYAQSSACADKMLSLIVDTGFFPRCQTFYLENNVLNRRTEVFFAQFLPVRNRAEREWEDFVGIFPNSYPSVEFSFHTAVNKANTHPNHYLFLKTNIQKSKIATYYQAQPKDYPFVIPIAGASYPQTIYFKDTEKTMEMELLPSSYNYFRVEKPCEISSPSSFILGKPVPLSHSPKRKKLVLNIFLDAASYLYMKETQFSVCPNIKAFFEKGIIFDQNFSVGEFTMPVYPSLHTGLYPKHHQFYDGEPKTLPASIETLAEKFQKAGYYCAAFSTEMQQVFSDSIRGFDRAVVQWGYSYPIQDLVEDTIAHLEAFSETDNFVWLAALDPHRVTENIPVQISAQTKKDFHETYQVAHDPTATSVFQKTSSMKLNSYHEILTSIDRQLGILFRYLEEHYQEGDYTVSLTSDHGATLLTEEEWLLKNIHSNTIFMLRGAGIPEQGIVTDEITSSVDFFPALCQAACIPYDEAQIDGRLPKALGGTGRAYSITESVFTGQTYKLDIRSKDYDFRLEASVPTTFEYRIDLNGCKTELLRWDTHEPVDDPEAVREFMKIAYRHTCKIQIRPDLYLQ